MSRDELMLKLKEKRVDTRLFFSGMHTQVSLLRFGCNPGGRYPVTDWLARDGMYLPSGSGLKEEDVRFVCDMIKA